MSAAASLEVAMSRMARAQGKTCQLCTHPSTWAAASGSGAAGGGGGGGSGAGARAIRRHAALISAADGRLMSVTQLNRIELLG